MIFYRVKKEADGVSVGRNFRQLVRNELYNERELEVYNIPMRYVIPVEVRKPDTYWFFGARFASGCGYND